MPRILVRTGRAGSGIEMPSSQRHLDFVANRMSVQVADRRALRASLRSSRADLRIHAAAIAGIRAFKPIISLNRSVRTVFRKASHPARPVSRGQLSIPPHWPQQAWNVTPTTAQAGRSGPTGVRGSPHDPSATGLEATGATSVRCAVSVWKSSRDPRSGSRSLPTVRHASRAILVRARAYNATRADNDPTNTS
jgi:hypothetical protein